MNLSPIKLSFIFVLILLGLTAFSQQLITSAGDNMSNANGSMSWSLGEVAIETYSNSSVVLTQGFHQPILKVLSLELNPKISITAFPNPTSEILYLQINDELVSGMNYQLYDIAGKQLMAGTITKNTTEILFSNQAFGTYILKIFKENNSVQSLKIIKE